MKSILLEQHEFDMVMLINPSIIVETKKAGMFIRCYLKQRTTNTEIFSLGRLIAIKESHNK